MPAIGPPWTELVAYDLNEGTVKWRTTLGTIPALAALGGIGAVDDRDLGAAERGRAQGRERLGREDHEQALARTEPGGEPGADQRRARGDRQMHGRFHQQNRLSVGHSPTST